MKGDPAVEWPWVRRAKGSESKDWGFRPKPPRALGVVSWAGVNSPWRLPISKEPELHLLKR